MNILVIQETDWLTRGPHTQHHIFERLSENASISISVIDYDIEHIQHFRSFLVKKQVFDNIHRVSKDSHIKVIRTAYLKIPYLRKISSLITNFFEILRIIRKDRPDIIVNFYITNGFIGLLLAKLFKIPFLFFYIDILHELVPIPYVKKIARLVTRFTLKHSDKVLAHTKYQYKYLINEGISPEDVSILPDGISLQNSVIDKKKIELLKAKYSINNEDFVIFFMGYLYEFAGLKEIIDYYNTKVNLKDLNLKFLILGDGGIYKFLQNYIKKIKANWVILTGKIPYKEIKEYVELADLCLLSFAINNITKEILPIKILEYMAMKKPVLTNSLPVVVYELKRESDLIFAKNQEDLIRMIGELIPQKENLKKIGQKGYKLVKEKYNWTKIITDFKKIIINLIKKS
ncbi:MAG: glycosyltransferase [Promethearchaeota archaeon]